ncbi:MAG TPA: hypothetical protein VMU62_06845, partial [Acidobacteriaceae bacterium]|nr:hypothetical protein [Acidobacteriaceae bacterium]
MKYRSGHGTLLPVLAFWILCRIHSGEIMLLKLGLRPVLAKILTMVLLAGVAGAPAYAGSNENATISPAPKNSSSEDI